MVEGERYQTIVLKYAWLGEGLADELTQFIEGEIGVGERICEKKIERIVMDSHSG